MSRLVDDMMQLVRLDQHPSAVLERVSLSSVVIASIERAQLADPDRRWCTSVQPDLVVVGDGELIARTVDNLLANILTHTPVETKSLVTTTRAGNSLVVEISDDGPGVPDEFLPHLFERFYRVGGRSQPPGSGLGLAIVADIVATHNGTIEAILNEPRGLLVRLTLPAANSRIPP